MTDESRPRGDESHGEELVAADDRIIGRAFKWSLLGIGVVGAVVASVLLFGGEAPPPEAVLVKELAAPARLIQVQDAIPAVAFTDVATASGIDFRHVSGATGQKFLPEAMGGGIAVLDYDDDGDSDLLFVNSDRWPEDPAPGPRPTMALYANDGRGAFTNVTRAAGLEVGFYGLGAAVGDYDNDGHDDLYITALGPNHLFHNVGGRFEDVTAEAGVAGGDDWSSSAGFFDYDNDGDLDLFVCNYVRWSRQIDLDLNFSLNGTDRAYGPPKSFVGTHSSLFRNDGNRKFTDVSKASGIAIDNKFSGEPAGKALAATFVDFDADGKLDVFVANDTVQNFLFHNRGDGTFEEVGVQVGIAYDGMGNATGAMGIDAARYRNDQTLGVVIGNFANEPTSLYATQGDPWELADVADVEGIGSPSRLRLKFGVLFLDYDLDGRLDLVQANGHLEEEINEIQPSQHYRQPAQLFWNVGDAAPSCFVEVDASTVGDLSREIVGRGAAYADLDGDGDLDLVITQTGGTPLVLRNEQQLGHHWLRVLLEGKTVNRNAIGAWVTLKNGGTHQYRQVMPTKSYLSQVEMPVTFGLGTESKVDSLTVTWPDGTTQDVPVDGVDRVIQVIQAG